jgi:ABC-2 type transport system ATP-binding protein
VAAPAKKPAAEVSAQEFSAGGSNAIRIQGVTAGYGRGTVLEGISFDVKKGETFGLIGLNGAGKTTLIKILLGFMEAKQGGVAQFGEERPEGSAKPVVAYLPEKFEPPFFLTGMEFIKFSLDLYRRPFDESAVLAAADRVDLSHEALSRRVNTYSKGMRQKLGLMGTWMTACPLLILDEPMSGLDPRARVLVKDEIAACRNRGMTVFLSTHILSDVEELCDRIGVIHGKSLRFLGTPAGLREQTGKDSLERAFLKVIEETTRI